MTITKTREGGYAISDIVNGYLVTIQYYGYTLREAKKKFRQEIKKAR